MNRFRIRLKPLKTEPDGFGIKNGTQKQPKNEAVLYWNSEPWRVLDRGGEELIIKNNFKMMKTWKCKPKEGKLSLYEFYHCRRRWKNTEQMAIFPIMFKLLKRFSRLLYVLCSLGHIRLFAAPWSPPGSSVRGIFQARELEWVAVSCSSRLLCDFKLMITGFHFSWKKVTSGDYFLNAIRTLQG